MFIPSDMPHGLAALDGSSTAIASVLCSWPLSGQYGPGARTLYYVLVVICILAPHIEWMRGACLAAALLFPAVAAIHALVLASVSETGGPVDLDIFGTFQLCAIGVLAVPITVRYSKTYFETRGRNMVFAWMVLNLAGLLGLIVAFYRASPQPCIDSQKNNVTLSAFINATSQHSSQVICAPQCSYTTAIRRDPSNPSQWVLAPNRGMTLNTATLLCAACCIPAILSLISVWQKVMHINWLKHWTRRHSTPSTVGGGPNEKQPEGLTPEEEHERNIRDDERWMDKKIRLVLGLVERIVFTVCIMAIVILGEMNFWSSQMRAGVEHMNGVGQWGPIVGVALAAFGSFFAVLSSGSNDNDEESFPGTPHGGADGQPAAPQAPTSTPGVAGEPGPGHRAKVNKGLFKLLQVLGTPGADRFADEVRTRNYREYPLIPGEAARNPTLAPQIAEFRQRRQETILSRRGSFTSAGPSNQDGDDSTNDNGHHRRRATRGTSHDSTSRPRSIISREDSGTELAQARTPRVTLRVPQRTYTFPREATTIPIRANPEDSPIRAIGVPRIIVDAVDSESERSVNV